MFDFQFQFLSVSVAISTQLVGSWKKNGEFCQKKKIMLLLIVSRNLSIEESQPLLFKKLCWEGWRIFYSGDKKIVAYSIFKEKI